MIQNQRILKQANYMKQADNPMIQKWHFKIELEIEDVWSKIGLPNHWSKNLLASIRILQADNPMIQNQRILKQANYFK